MDQFNHNSVGQSIQSVPELNQHSNSSQLRPDCRLEIEPKECKVVRKAQKADREKLRRDRLNEQFMELGSTIDPDCPKNDKASILGDTIQVLKDLTAQVNRLKAEYASLTEESRELAQEKNDLKEEKASLKSDIESLNLQYQQRYRAMFPWGGMDHSVVMHPPTYPYPMPMPLPPGSIPMHPSLQPYPFFGNQTPALVPNPCSTYVPYLTPNTFNEQQSAHFASPAVPPGSRSHVSSKQDSVNKSAGQGESKTNKDEDSNEVATELELKTPGSTADQGTLHGQRKSKRTLRKESSLSDDNSSSRCSSSRTVQVSSLDSVVGGGSRAVDTQRGQI